MAAKTYDEALRLDGEAWRPIPGFDGYEASTLGRIRSFRSWSKTIMSPTKNQNGYLSVKLRVNGQYKHLKVHRAILMAHVGLPQDDQCAAHSDGDRTNNALTNLRWCSRAENERDKFRHGTSNRGRRNGMSILDESDVSLIRSSAPSTASEYRLLAKQIGVTPHTIYLVATRRVWGHV